MSDQPATLAAPAPLLLTSRQAAAALGVCEKTLWQLRRDGLLPTVRLGTVIRFDVHDLAALIDRAKSQGGAP